MSLKPSPLFVLPLMVLASAASAADLSPVLAPPPVFLPPAPSFDPQTHVHVEGGPIFSQSRITTDPADKFGYVPDDRGFYVAAALRHLFRPEWSFQVAGTATWLRELTAVEPEAYLTADLDFQTFDLDIGFHPTRDIHTRVFGGIRVLHSSDWLQLEIPIDLSLSTGDMWLFGPRAGVSSQIPLGTSRFSFVAEFSASALFGEATVFFDTPYDTVDMSGQRTALNLEGQAGVHWSPGGTGIELTVGYRGQQWWGLRQGTTVDTFDGAATIDADKFLHGPFARFGFDF